ncbi:hypothetical protein [Pseudomonas entomophila]|uniref:hypothetical protein n=1 Tax=Pseudomonas entomophila TaxID=312306 RepID=UPI0020104C62|nr:hypothetical protein [Pseudomonas entomophila]
MYKIGFYENLDGALTAPEVVIREFPGAEYEKFRGKTAIIWNVHSLYSSWLTVFNNYQEYIGLGKTEEELKVHPRVYVTRSAAYSSVSETARVTINLLASASAFLVISQRLVKVFSSSNKGAYLKWDELRKTLYSQSVAYQICYGLRNFSQHYMIPFSGVNLNFKGRAVEGFAPFINRDEILNCGYDWGKNGAAVALRSQPENICLSELLGGYYSCLREIFVSAHEVFEAEVKDARKCVDDVILKFGLPKNVTPTLFTIELGCSDFNKMSQEDFPVGLLNFIDEVVLKV